MPRLGHTVDTAPGGWGDYCCEGAHLWWKRWIPRDLTGVTNTDLENEKATRDTVLTTLRTEDPAYFFGFGHGNADVFTGYQLDRIISTFDPESLQAFRGRVVHLLSCSTAQRLGPALILNGARAYIGYIGPAYCAAAFVPYEHPAYYSIEDCDFEWDRALASGLTVRQAWGRVQTKYNEWVEWWRESDDPLAEEAIQCLLWNLNVTRCPVHDDAYGDPEATITAPTVIAGLPVIALAIGLPLAVYAIKQMQK